MGKVILQMQTTLDGFQCGPQNEMDWSARAWTPDIEAYVGDLMKDVGTILLGRKLAEGFIPAWEHYAETGAETGAKEMNEMPKLVFSHTLKKSPWVKVPVTSKTPKAEIAWLKKESDKDIIVYGGIDFVQSLVADGLLEEIYLLVNPVAIGKGRSVFAGLKSKRELELVEATPFECGITALHYRPVAKRK